MKTIILAGGLGTRLSEETTLRPKPMVEIGGMPILLHILNIYHAHGFSDFIVACGYKGEIIKDFFANFQSRNTDWSIRLADGEKTLLRNRVPAWTVAPVDTGANTMTGGRIKQLQRIVGDSPFMVTYGDGVADIDIGKLVEHHRSHGKLATVTAVHPPARFGCLELDGDKVSAFAEKPQTSEGWINGGFFVFEPEVFDYLDGDECVLEKSPLERLARSGQLVAHKHDGFWQPMDTLRDKQLLEELWNAKRAPWKVWHDQREFFDRDSEQEGSHLRIDRFQGPVARKVA
jgi:glucose-1-phosphate cytidylyltransferase